MKIKKLESLIKKSKSVAIVEDGGAFKNQPEAPEDPQERLYE